MKGIYKIINLVNDKFYLGSSINCDKRKYTHFSQLRNNKHHSIILQRAWNKYGEHNFIFKIIKECENCLEEEQEWLNSLDWKKCYNISKFANGGDTISNHPNKKIILDKIVKNLENNRNNIKPKYKDKNGNWKGGISITNCLNCNKVIRTPSKLCSECFHKQKNYTKNRNPFYNKRHTKETKELMSKKRKKEGYMGGQEKAVVIDGNEYKSVSEASRQLKVVPNTIINRIRNEKFSTYKYKEIC